MRLFFAATLLVLGWSLPATASAKLPEAASDVAKSRHTVPELSTRAGVSGIALLLLAGGVAVAAGRRRRPPSA